MKTATPTPAKSISMPAALDRHLAVNSPDDLSGLASYVERGAALVTPPALVALRRLGKPLREKIEAIADSDLLRRRLELLATYFDEAARDGHHGTPAHREVAFALLYFLKGFDRIPDSVPEIGLLDDAMVVQFVLERHATTLRAHCLQHGRAWPAEH